MNASRRLSIIVAGLVLSAGVLSPAAQAQSSTDPWLEYFGYTPEVSTGCAEVEVVVTSGSGNSAIDNDPQDINSFANGANFAKHLTQQFPEVRAWQTPYYSSVGIVTSREPTTDLYYPPYGVSARAGVKTVEKHLQEVAAACPETKFILTGFSQGAQITGDVAASIAQGQGIAPSKLLAAYLLADPGRSAFSGETGTSVTGVTGPLSRAGAVIVGTNKGQPRPETVGLSGPRPDGVFASLPGKVVSICSSGDPACEITPGGALAAVGKWASEQEDDHIYQQAPAQTVQSMIDDRSLFKALLPHVLPLLEGIRNGDKEQIYGAFQLAASQAWLTSEQQVTIKLLGYEFSEAFAEMAPFLPLDDILNEQHRTPEQQLEVMIQAWNQPTGISELPALFGFFDRHFTYLASTPDFTTIDGVRVDDWLEAEMSRQILLNKYGEAAPVVEARPVSTRKGLRQDIGRLLWHLVRVLTGDDSRESRLVFELFEL